MCKALKSRALRSLKRRWLASLIVPFFLQSLPLHLYAQDLSVATYAGNFAHALETAFFSPFEQENGITIHINQRNNMLATLRAQTDSGSSSYDIVTLSATEATQACNDGLLTPVDTDTWLSNSTVSPGSDFLAGALLPCAVAISSYAMPYVFDSENFSMDQPKTIADFFDVGKFPGNRGLSRSSIVSLVWALLADGVPDDKVYAALRTHDGVARAFRKLDDIKDHVVWWDRNQSASTLLLQGKVVMTSIWSTQLPELTKQMSNLGQVWDGHIADFDYFAIPSGATTAPMAIQLLKYATDSEAQLRLGSQSNLGPVRHSSIVNLGVQFQCASGTCPCKGSNTCSKSCCKSRTIFDPSFMLSKEVELRERLDEWAQN